jgi:hypothetical protein
VVVWRGRVRRAVVLWHGSVGSGYSVGRHVGMGAGRERVGQVGLGRGLVGGGGGDGGLGMLHDKTQVNT